VLHNRDKVQFCALQLTKETYVMTNTTQASKPASKPTSKGKAKTASQILAASRDKAKAKADAIAARNIAKIASVARKAAETKPLPVLRMAFIDATIKGQGSTMAYANSLTAQFGTGWEKITLSGPCKPNEKLTRQAIKDEKTILYDALKAKGHSNPSVVWGRVIKAAEGPKAKGAKVNAPRAIDKRQAEELSKLYKAFFSSDDCNDNACKANAAIAAILLDIFKVDIGSLKS